MSFDAWEIAHKAKGGFGVYFLVANGKGKGEIRIRYSTHYLRQTTSPHAQNVNVALAILRKLELFR